MITIEELECSLRSMPEARPQSYRLYHDDLGRPVCYSMEELPGTWIEIDQNAFVRSSPWVRVKNGRLEEHVPWLTTKKLQPGLSGTACCPHDVAIVVSDTNHQKWSVKYHDAD